MKSLRDWIERRKRIREARRRIETAAREHARQTLECGLCHDALAPEEFAIGFCTRCWALRDETSAGVRPLGMRTQ